MDATTEKTDAQMQGSEGVAAAVPGGGPATAPIDNIQQLLRARDDTSRFVGLALLKSTLDNSEELRNDTDVVSSLWDAISPKFLDRLLRTGSKPGAASAEVKEMLDLAVAIIYTFSALLPVERKSDAKLLGRLPLLVEAVLPSTGETTDLILKSLLTLVSSSTDGCTAFAALEDWSPLIDIAPTHPLVLSILAWSWIYGKHQDPVTTRSKIDQSLSALIASYRGTDAVTLLDFLGKLLSRLDSLLIPRDPKWLNAVIEFVRGLAASKPTPASREAYTNCVANLLVTYQDKVARIIFGQALNSDKFSYLFVNLILIDVRSSLPTMLEKLNTPEYPALSERLTSALIIMSFFINHLLRTMDEADDAVFADGEAELLLKLRDSVVETLSLLVEYLRDRWDAAVAGVQGLHYDVRYGKSHTASGSFMTLTWDSKHEGITEDRFLLAALRVLGDWIREDDAPTLRRDAINLMDLLIDLYQPSTAARVGITTRPLVLGVLDGILKLDEGVQALSEHGGWSVLSKDLLNILADSAETDAPNHVLGQHITEILMTLSETRSNTPEEWLDLVTGVAAYNVPPSNVPELSLQQLWADVLQLATSLLVNAPSGVKRQYCHSAGAVVGVALVILEKRLDDQVRGEVQDAMTLLQNDPILSTM